MSTYRDKKVFVTGGSSGIGKALALRLAAQGAHVAIAARSADKLEAALDEVKTAGPGGTHLAVPLDVGNKAEVAAAAPRVLEGLDGLDILVNNAGITWPAYLAETPPDVFEHQMQVNYLGTVYTTLAFLPHFMEQRSGHVANVSSTLGFLGIFGYAAYAASKFAVTGFSDCLRQDLLPYGVQVHVLFPADTDTPQHSWELERMPAETRAIADTAGLSSAESVADALLDGMERGRFHIVPGFMNRATWLATRYAPGLVRGIADVDLKKAWTKRTGEKI